MKNLVEAIINNKVEAQEIFESRMIEIREKKLYEVKRNLGENLGGMSRAALQALKDKGAQKYADYVSGKSNKKDRSKSISRAKHWVGRYLEKGKGSTLSKLGKLAWRGYVKGSNKNKSNDDNGSYYAKWASGQDNTSTEKPNGVIRRNWNTFRGREPDDKPEEKKKGRLGRFVKGVAGLADIDTSKSVAGIASDVLARARTGPLEEETYRFKTKPQTKIIKKIGKSHSAVGPKIRRKKRRIFGRITKDK